ncbi:MAG: hypothetical protein N3G75_08370 [Methanothrix sp.]|nr:hypothetical protein [Methanothrix sp.]MCX8207827.1 hypothetical protein [Methanothrix sp.]
MVEREVTIRLSLVDEIGDRLLELKKQRDALARSASVTLKARADDIDRVQETARQIRRETALATKDLSDLCNAVSSKAVPQVAQYQRLMGSALLVARSIGPGIATALVGVSNEFKRQRDLAQFWGTTGYLHLGLHSFKNALLNFLSTGGAGLTKWLRDVSYSLTSLRTTLAASGAAMLGFAAAVGLSSKHAQNYIQSTLSTGLMARRLTDRKAAEAWIQQAQQVDWSAGRESRMAVFQTVLSKAPYLGQSQAQEFTEAIEKYFFANREMLAKKGITSAEQLASEISAPVLTGEAATIFEDIFGLGFSRMHAQARLARLASEAAEIDIGKAVAMRPDEVLQKRLVATSAVIGDTVIPVLNRVLGAFLAISDAIGKIPGLGAAIGWTTVLSGAAAAGLVLLSVMGSMIQNLRVITNLIHLDTVRRVIHTAAIYAQSAAIKAVTAAQWLFNAAMSANPLGILILAVAGLVALLIALEKRFHLVSRALNAFKETRIGGAIASSIESIKEKLDQSYKKLSSSISRGDWKGVIKLGLDALISASPLALISKVLIGIYDFIRKIWINTGIVNKWISMLTGLVQTVVDFIRRLWRSITGIWDWLTSKLWGLFETVVQLIPGGKRALAWLEFSETLNRYGLRYDEKTGKYYSKTGEEIPESNVPEAVRAMQQKWSEQPTFAEDLKGMFDSLVDALYTKFKPLFDAIVTALGFIGGFLEALSGGKWVASSVVNVWNEIKGLPHVMAETAGSMGGYNLPPEGPVPVTGSVTTAPIIRGSDNNEYAWNPKTKRWDMMIESDVGPVPIEIDQSSIPQDVLKRTPGMAVGGSIISGGLAVLHRGEEVAPARVVSGGKTVLERFTERVVGSRGPEPVHISAPVSVNVEIGSVSSDLDLDRLAHRLGSEAADKLLFALRNKLDNLYNRNIAYMRG